MRTVEKRIEKLEANVPDLPCKKPGHENLFLFVKRYGYDNSEIEDQIAEIRSCPRCKDKQIVVLQRFAGASEQQQASEEPEPINIIIGEGEPLTPEPQPRITFQDWTRPTPERARLNPRFRDWLDNEKDR